MTSNTKSSRTTGNEAGLEGVKSALDPLTILFTGLPNFRLWFIPFDPNLVPRSLVDEASPVRNVTGDERAHAWNKSSKWQSCFDVLNNEFDRAVGEVFSNKTWLYAQFNQLICCCCFVFFFNIKFNEPLILNSLVMARTEGSKQYALTSTRQFSFTLFKMSLYLDTERAFKKS